METAAFVGLCCGDEIFLVRSRTSLVVSVPTEEEIRNYVSLMCGSRLAGLTDIQYVAAADVVSAKMQSLLVSSVIRIYKRRPNLTIAWHIRRVGRLSPQTRILREKKPFYYYIRALLPRV